ncbi:carbonic anhydrase [Longispora albida]|uniref:carbonic anhydrase n=1 Tax=Longispora albida TaxID=203523 RepID=UPI00037FDE1A|nr:carbonic anhydrase [Longispora albida]
MDDLRAYLLSGPRRTPPLSAPVPVPAPVPKFFSRRLLLRAGLAGAGLAWLGADTVRASETPPAVAHDPVSAEYALRLLKAGNQRYARNHEVHPDASAGHRSRVASGQHPFALVVGCVDSRVPPELVFDLGLGDLLVVRTAGHVLDAVALASVEFGVKELHVPLVVVLGHSRCGAVTAAVQHVLSGTAAPGRLGVLVEQIAPAVREARTRPGDLVQNTVRCHVDRVRRELAAEDSCRVVGARYDLDTGRVSFTG